MSIINLAIADAVEPQAVESGTYELQLASLTIEKSEKGNQYLLAAFKVLNMGTGIKRIRHMMMIPTSNDDEDQQNLRKIALIRFFTAVGVPDDVIQSGSFDTEAIGRDQPTCWAVVTLKEDDEYGEQNRIKRFVVDFDAYAKEGVE